MVEFVLSSSEAEPEWSASYGSDETFCGSYGSRQLRVVSTVKKRTPASLDWSASYCEDIVLEVDNRFQRRRKSGRT